MFDRLSYISVMFAPRMYEVYRVHANPDDEWQRNTVTERELNLKDVHETDHPNCTQGERQQRQGGIPDAPYI